MEETLISNLYRAEHYRFRRSLNEKSETVNETTIRDEDETTIDEESKKIICH